MLRIGQVETTATSDGLYTDGSVAGGVAATRLRAAAFNALQEELAHIVEEGGFALSIDDTTQVLKALKMLFLSRSNPFGDIASDGPDAIATALSNLGLGTAAKLSAAVATQASPGYLLIPALVSGVEKQLILQWGSFAGLTSGDTAVTFPFPFPNQCWHVFPNALVTGTGAFAGCNSPTKTGFNGNMWASNTVRQSGTSSYWALGF